MEHQHRGAGEHHDNVADKRRLLLGYTRGELGRHEHGGHSHHERNDADDHLDGSDVFVGKRRRNRGHDGDGHQHAHNAHGGSINAHQVLDLGFIHDPSLHLEKGSERPDVTIGRPKHSTISR